MPANQDLIWVDKDFAEKWKMLTEDKATREQQEGVFNAYLEKVTEDVRREFEASLESLEEDAAMFTGLMLKVKQAFGKAKDEYLDASYALWDDFEKERPNVSKKIDSLVSMLIPLTEELEKINGLIKKINTWDIDKLRESLSHFSALYGANKEMVEFLIMNFKRDGE